MIRNVKDNNHKVNPYTTRDSNLRLGRFYSNRLDDKTHAQAHHGLQHKLHLAGFISEAVDRLLG